MKLIRYASISFVVMNLIIIQHSQARTFKSQAATISIKASSGNTLPEGAVGLASQYTGDTGLASDTNVLYFDDFESYNTASNLIGAGKWDSGYGINNIRIASEAGNFYSGTKAAEFTLPKTSGEVSIEIFKEQNLPKLDTVFVRFYGKYATGFDVLGSSHNGVFVASNYWRGLCQSSNSCGPGVKANGKNKFLISYEATRSASNQPNPGSIATYIYHPEQRDIWGDIFFPTGRVIPFDLTPYEAFNGTYSQLPTYIPFVSRPEVTPQLNKWHCFEIMVKANTPGSRDGRMALWIDGKLIADFTNLRLRDIAELKIDHIGLSLHGNGGILETSKKYYDNVVIAKSYIGPMK
ncbi:MAG: hypothetical protein AB7N80_11480 [Bdellovibrionales bacterium]